MFRFTREERLVVATLSIIFLIGIGLHYATKKNPHLWNLVNFTNSDTVYERVDINRASREELIRIPRIGPVTADRILSYRQEQGFFRTLDELKNVPGIGEATYSGISKFFLPVRIEK